MVVERGKQRKVKVLGNPVLNGCSQKCQQAFKEKAVRGRRDRMVGSTHLPRLKVSRQMGSGWGRGLLPDSTPTPPEAAWGRPGAGMQRVSGEQSQRTVYRHKCTPFVEYLL